MIIVMILRNKRKITHSNNISLTVTKVLTYLCVSFSAEKAKNEQKVTGQKIRKLPRCKYIEGRSTKGVKYSFRKFQKIKISFVVLAFEC